MLIRVLPEALLDYHVVWTVVKPRAVTMAPRPTYNEGFPAGEEAAVVVAVSNLNGDDPTREATAQLTATLAAGNTSAAALESGAAAVRGRHD